MDCKLVFEEYTRSASFNDVRGKNICLLSVSSPLLLLYEPSAAFPCPPKELLVTLFSFPIFKSPGDVLFNPLGGKEDGVGGSRSGVGEISLRFPNDLAD